VRVIWPRTSFLARATKYALHSRSLAVHVDRPRDARTGLSAIAGLPGIISKTYRELLELKQMAKTSFSEFFYRASVREAMHSAAYNSSVRLQSETLRKMCIIVVLSRLKAQWLRFSRN